MVENDTGVLEDVDNRSGELDQAVIDRALDCALTSVPGSHGDTSGTPAYSISLCNVLSTVLICLPWIFEVVPDSLHLQYLLSNEIK